MIPERETVWQRSGMGFVAVNEGVPGPGSGFEETVDLLLLKQRGFHLSSLVMGVPFLAPARTPSFASSVPTQSA